MTGVIYRLLGEGFRIFFLAAGVYAVFAMLVWEGWLMSEAAGADFGLPFATAPQLWHAHEMIFGFTGAALGGFFLTAVPNWTGAKEARHLFIGFVAALWLAGRLAIWFAAHLPPGLVAIADLAYLPVLASKIAVMLIRRPKPQNVMFLGLLALVWAGNLMVHLEWFGWADTLSDGLRLGLLGVAAMIAVIGGRVTPAFTRNAMLRDGVETGLPVSLPWLDRAGIASAIALPLSFAFGAPEALTGLIALAAGATLAARLAGWRGLRAWRQPILWSLHLGLTMLALGYLTLGFAVFGWGSEVAALHLLGIGAAGGMTIAMMSRATLGHSGQALVAPRPVAVGYGLVALAALLRWFGGLSGDWYMVAILGSGALWILAFALFTLSLWPALSQPRLPRTGGAA